MAWYYTLDTKMKGEKLFLKFGKKNSVVRTKKYGKLIRLFVILASVILVAGLIAYGWQHYEEEKYPEGTEKDYSLPNAFIDFARLINDYITQNMEKEQPEDNVDDPDSEEDEEDNIIIVGSNNSDEQGENVPEEEQEPEVRGGFVPEGDNAGYYSFKDTLFVGDYFISNAHSSGYFEHSKFAYASGNGIDMNTLITKNVLKIENEMYTLAEYVDTIENIEAVYIIISAESVSWMDTPTFVKKYTAFVEDIIEAQPEAHIYVQLILPINEEKAAKRGYSVTNAKINEINEYIVKFAEENSIWILDPRELYADKEGKLPLESTTNGIRFEKDGYEPWAKYILTHKAH